MKKEAFNIFCLLVLTSCLILQIGCASFPPPHANSFYTKDEIVTVKMLRPEDFKQDYKGYLDDWKKSFQHVGISTSPDVKGIVPAVSLVIGIVAPLAFDYAKKQLKQEAENYVQQFGTTSFDAFWKKDRNEYTQKYYGFEIVRKANRYNDKTQKDAKEVFKLVYGLGQDGDGVFWAAPLYFVTNKTKAKIASWGGSHRVDTKVELALDAVWIDGKKYHKENIAKFDPLMIKGYDIDNPKALRASCDKSKDPTCSPLEDGLNSFPPVPIPSGISSSDAGDFGKFWLTVLVTESDTAKTKKYISDLSDLLEKNRDKIIDFIKSQAK